MQIFAIFLFPKHLYFCVYCNMIFAMFVHFGCVNHETEKVTLSHLFWEVQLWHLFVCCLSLVYCVSCKSSCRS